MGRKSKKKQIGRVSAIVLGAIFVLAGIFKVGDPWSFLGSLPAYGIPSAIRLPIAVVMPTIEVVLGVMLIAGWRTKEASIATGAFLVVFGAAIAYGWNAGTLQDCGCFGPLLKRSPPVALAQDAAMMVLAVLAMLWAPSDARSFAQSFSRVRIGTLATVSVVSMAMIASALFADPGTLEERLTSAEAVVGASAPSLAALNLGSRDVFLYLFHPDCPHCIENGPLMALIAKDPDLPELIGITHSVDPGEVRNYLRHAGADFKAYEFSVPGFLQITSDGRVPQLVYLKHGKVEQIWLGDIPTPAQLETFVSLQ